MGHRHRPLSGAVPRAAPLPMRRQRGLDLSLLKEIRNGNGHQGAPQSASMRLVFARLWP